VGAKLERKVNMIKCRTEKMFLTEMKQVFVLVRGRKKSGNY